MSTISISKRANFKENIKKISLDTSADIKTASVHHSVFREGIRLSLISKTSMSSWKETEYKITITEIKVVYSSSGIFAIFIPLLSKGPNLPHLLADGDDALFTTACTSSFHLPFFYRCWDTKTHDASKIIILCPERIKQQQNAASSYLYKAICHHPDTSVPNHPETQTQMLSRLLTSPEGTQTQLENKMNNSTALTLIRKDVWKMFSTVRENESGSMTNS